MNFDLSTFLASSAAVATASSSIWLGYRHIRYSIQDKKDKERKAILDKANEELAKVESTLEEKIHHLKTEFEAHKVSLNKDLDFMRTTYNAEIKVLGEKIENLRQDLSTQHSQMVALLTKLIQKD